jgi:hypothetical protein
MYIYNILARLLQTVRLNVALGCFVRPLKKGGKSSVRFSKLPGLGLELFPYGTGDHAPPRLHMDIDSHNAYAYAPDAAHPQEEAELRVNVELIRGAQLRDEREDASPPCDVVWRSPGETRELLDKSSLICIIHARTQ